MTASASKEMNPCASFTQARFMTASRARTFTEIPIATPTVSRTTAVRPDALISSQINSSNAPKVLRDAYPVRFLRPDIGAVIEDEHCPNPFQGLDVAGAAARAEEEEHLGKNLGLC